jgi:signal transduction histidine kinase
LAVDGAVLSDATALELAGAIVAGVAIAVRRRAPAVALGLAVANQVLLIAAGQSDRLGSTFVAVLIAVYTTAVYAPRRRLRTGALIATAALAATLVATGSAIQIVPLVLLMAAAGAAGLPGRAARRQAERLQTLGARLAGERDARARLAVLGERARLARELHDSVAHAVSVMVLQAAAAEAVLDTEPGRARESARTVEALGRDALRELQALLGMLGEDQEPGSRAPRPSLGRLDELIARVADTGLAVELRVSGHPLPLPAGVDMSAYRIIQEALTNTLKHAGPVRTVVALHYGRDTLGVEIADQGADRPADANGTGHGLIGMRERVALHGGTLHAGPQREAGYAVRAELPLTPSRQ